MPSDAHALSGSLRRLGVRPPLRVPVGLEVLEAINVRVGAGKILIPDLAVVAVPGLDHLRVELGEAGPSAVVYRLKRDRYVEVARVDPNRPLVLTEPVAVTLNLAALAVATRPPGATAQ